MEYEYVSVNFNCAKMVCHILEFLNQLVLDVYSCNWDTTVKPFIANTSEEFIKCRLDNFSMSFILHYVNFRICENK